MSNLVAEAISQFAQDSRFDVWICGEGPPDLQYNVVKELHDDFKDRGRLLLFNGDAKPIDKLLLFLSVGPHAVLSFPGWTCGDLAEVLYALNQLNVKIFNTLGYAGPMHFPEGITCTIVGPAVGRVQKGSKTREPLAIFGDRESYQPPQSKLKPPDQLSGWSKTEARRALNLPLDAFIAVVPMKLDRLEQESILYYINYLQRTENSCVVLVVRAKSMREQIEEWIASSCASPDIRSRFLFRSAVPNTEEFHNLLCAGDASLDSLSNFSAHTTAQDAIDCGLGHFSKNDPEGLMQSRVGAEVSIAAGLEHVCVGKTGQETIDLLVRYTKDSALRERTSTFIAANRREKTGLFNVDRAPQGWAAAILFYMYAQKGENGKFPDYDIPSKHHVPVLQEVEQADTAVNAILKKMLSLDGVVESSSVPAHLRDMLREIQSQANIEFLELVGSGTFLHTIRCQAKTGEHLALKVSRKKRLVGRRHNDPVFRQVANLMVWEQRTKRSPFRPLLPGLRHVLQGGRSCCGNSSPDEEGKVFSFMFEEFIEGEAFSDRIVEHRERWQQQGIFTDKLRLDMFNLPCQALFWLQHYNLSIMDIKPDNIIFRTSGENKGTITIVDTDLGHAFPSTASMQEMGYRTEDQGQAVALLNRRCTSVALALGESKTRQQKATVFPLGRKNQGIIQCITRQDMQAFLIRAAHSGLASLGAGSTGFRQEESVIKHHVERRKYIRTAAALRVFDRKWAFAADYVAVHKMLLMLLTLKPGQQVAAWDAQAQEEFQKGEAGFRRMLMSSLNSGATVQQPMAFNKLVDFFAGSLGPGEGRDAKQSMLHLWNTTPILEPEVELAIRTGGCYPMPDGYVWVDGALRPCPLVSVAVQPGKGLGLRAEEDIPEGTAIGAYAGTEVMNSVIGVPYETREYPSRCVAVVRGGVQGLNQSSADKISVDGQINSVRDWTWVKHEHNVGPFLNAPNDGDPDDKANCTLDRHSLRKDDSGVWWMVMYSSELIRKGTFLQWKYDPRAGASAFFNFS